MKTKKYPTIKIHRHRKRRKVKRYLFALFSVIVVLFVFLLFYSDRVLLPTAFELTSIKARSKVNAVINESIKNAIIERGLTSSSFYLLDPAGSSERTFSINTFAVNEFCAELATDISNALQLDSAEEINVPIGLLLGVQSIAHLGPSIPIKLLPLGVTEIDYESSFVTAGINQVNFKLWLNTKTTMQIINPAKPPTIVVTRKILLVDTVITGEVPAVTYPFR